MDTAKFRFQATAPLPPPPPPKKKTSRPVSYFSLWCLSRSIINRPPSWFLKVSEVWEEWKVPVGTEETDTPPHHLHAFTSQPPYPRGLFTLPRFRSPWKKKKRNRNKMAARRFRRSTATTTRRKVTENGGLWSGNEVCLSIVDPTYTLKFLISPCFQKSDKERKGNVVMTTMQLQDSQPWTQREFR